MIISSWQKQLLEKDTLYSRIIRLDPDLGMLRIDTLKTMGLKLVTSNLISVNLLKS